MESSSRQWKSQAKRQLSESSRFNPKLTKAHALLAYLPSETADYQTAEAFIRRALQFDSGNGVYLRLLLVFLLAQEKNSTASRWLKKLAAL